MKDKGLNKSRGVELALKKNEEEYQRKMDEKKATKHCPRSAGNSTINLLMEIPCQRSSFVLYLLSL